MQYHCANAAGKSRPAKRRPEAIFLGRREFLAGAGALAATAGRSRRALADDADPSAALYPAKRNDAYKLDREVTPEKINLNYKISMSSAPTSTSTPTR